MISRRIQTNPLAPAGWLASGLRILSIVVLCGATVSIRAVEVGEWADLFDGNTLDGWRQLGGAATYDVQDGMIVGTTSAGSPNSFLCTEASYGDFVLELEFQVDEGLNSGIQVRSQSLPSYRDGIVHGYQVEIDPAQEARYVTDPPNLRANGDVIAPDTEPRRWTGGIYDEKRRGWLADLTRNEAARNAFKPGEWNHFRIEAVGDSIRTWINGVYAAGVVDSMTPNGFIGLQVHATKEEEPMQVRWKNIRIQDLGFNAAQPDSVDSQGEEQAPVRLQPSPTLNMPPPDGAVVLFDGRNLDAWGSQKPKEWETVDGPADDWNLLAGGRLEAVPGAGSIITRQKFGSGSIHLEFRTLGPVNSGVYLQSRYEIGLNDSYGQTEGSPCGAPGNFSGPDSPVQVPNLAAPPYQWQTLDIRFWAPRFNADGTEKVENARVTVSLNGVALYTDFEITAVKGAASRLGEAPAGALMLQEHGAPIQFRNIWILEEPDS